MDYVIAVSLILISGIAALAVLKLCKYRILREKEAELIAKAFAWEYPVTEFMDGNYLDFSSATVKNDVDINVALIGFGGLNRRIFLTSVATNRLLTKVSGELRDKPVNYWIFDKSLGNERALRKNYSRFAECLDGDSKKYLPLPQKPANEVFIELKIGGEAFFEKLKEKLSAKGNSRPYNYVVAALGSDGENFEFAEKLTARLKEWGLNGCTKVFVPARGDLLPDKEKKDYIVISAKDGEKIDKRLGAMAKDRHLCYVSEETADEKAAEREAEEKWRQWTKIQRESNLYACLSVRAKLQLTGFDAASKEEEGEDAYEEFKRVYEKDDPIVYDEKKGNARRKSPIYTNDFIEGSVRRTYAVLEHDRWNAYMITCGVIPSTIKQIGEEGVKNLEKRRHGNLTTFDGLVGYRKLIAGLKGVSEEETDVIRYDYQIMDDLIWLLSRNGFKIIKKRERNNDKKGYFGGEPQ